MKGEMPMFENLFPIEWDAFHFLRPQFLWLLIPVAVIVVLGWLNQKKDEQWKKAIALHLRPYVIKKGTERVRFWMNMILGAMLSLGVMALAGPTWKKVQLPGQQLETPVAILLDLSQSMMAKDIQPNRLERAKFKINDLLNHNPGARIALIGFAGTAHTIVPLTKDYDIIRNHIDGLKPSIMPFPGSNLQAAFKQLDSVFNVTKAPGRVLVFSDDYTNNHFETIRSFVQNSIHEVTIIPFNTLAGSEIPSYTGKGVLLGKDGEKVLSVLNESLLTQLEAIDGVEVQPLTLDDSDVETISKNILDHLEFTDQPEDKENNWQDAGLLLLIPVAAMLLFWFRKGWVLYSVLFLFLTSCHQNQSFKDLWFTKDYQGQQFINNGKFTEAAESFEDPMRRGIAWFKAGEYEKAVKSFSQDTSAMGTYNMGLAYLKNGDTLAAKLAFGMAVHLDPENEQARKNQQLLAHLTPGQNEVDLQDASEVTEEGGGQNKQNDSPEDLSGGGQEATKEDMQKERMEETVSTDTRKTKELDEVPDDIGSTVQQPNSKVLMRKVDDDPALFLKRKFAYQVKKYKLQPSNNEDKW